MRPLRGAAAQVADARGGKVAEAGLGTGAKLEPCPLHQVCGLKKNPFSGLSEAR